MGMFLRVLLNEYDWHELKKMSQPNKNQKQLEQLEHVHIIRLRWSSQLKSSIGQYGYNATTHLLTCQLISHFHCLSCESPPGTAGCCISPLTSKQITCLSWLAYWSRTISDQRSGSWKGRKVESVGSVRQQKSAEPSTFAKNAHSWGGLTVLYNIYVEKKKFNSDFQSLEWLSEEWAIVFWCKTDAWRRFVINEGIATVQLYASKKAEISEFLQKFGSPLWIKRLQYCCGPLLCIRNHPFFCFSWDHGNCAWGQSAEVLPASLLWFDIWCHCHAEFRILDHGFMVVWVLNFLHGQGGSKMNRWICWWFLIRLSISNGFSVWDRTVCFR